METATRSSSPSLPCFFFLLFLLLLSCLFSSVDARVIRVDMIPAQTSTSSISEDNAFSRIHPHGSGPSPGQGHWSINFRKTLGGIQQSGPSPGEGHKP
ncbi:hypothetical protein CDL15_Pgr001717 [Punica granatum]|uniref:Uncharacterized protein n=1 Tax=Punica granatum TaxID=22663 RepID=A0A218XB30_PUNGR|nr:hypothetical protein CDL15_Pgr001717 [Punica granatum]PKI41264.1 hypothetical protein CRG98_038376 [Punica granatum]